MKAVLALGAAFAAIVLWAVLARAFAPHGNTALTRFDAILVLGSPTDSDGNPTPTQLARVSEGVREYERNVAPRILMSGGAAHNQFVEARSMANTAASQGIPAPQIFLESHSLDTIQNACYATRIMKQHGWHSAEVVSSAAHLPRAALIFSKTGIAFRTHAAPPVEPESAFSASAASFVETIKTMRYLVYAQWSEDCEP